MIYLDSAATSFQKPTAVAQTVHRAMQRMSSPGRGRHSASQAAEEAIFRCRDIAAELFHAPSVENVVCTMNATHGLNIAIKTLVPQGGRVLISGYEHNAVTRPLHALEASVTVAASPLFDQEATLAQFRRCMVSSFDAVICTHISNVFGFVLPIEEIAALCRAVRVPLIVDASQSAGVLPIDMQALGAEFIAMPGHKGLYGPQGTGLLLCRGDAKPLIEGGTGSDSLRQDMPAFLPDRLEAGTHNVPGIAGLAEGMRFVRRMGTKRILRHERNLLAMLRREISTIPAVRQYASEQVEAQTGVLSFTVDGWEPETVGEALAHRGIAVRAGLHCAPCAHHTAGTLPDGTVRVSVSAFNRAEEVSAFAAQLRQILRSQK